MVTETATVGGPVWDTMTEEGPPQASSAQMMKGAVASVRGRGDEVVVGSILDCSLLAALPVVLGAAGASRCGDALTR